MNGVNTLKCPKCDQEMDSGYIYSGGKIAWANDNKKKSTIIGDEVLYSNMWGWTHKKIVAYRCIECSIVTFKYD